MSLEIEENNNSNTLIYYQSINPMLSPIQEIDEDNNSETELNNLNDKYSSEIIIPNSIIDFDCPICFEKLQEKDSIQLICCNKNIHLKCIQNWFLNNPDLKETQKGLCLMCRVESETMKDIYKDTCPSQNDLELGLERGESIYSRNYRSEHSCSFSKFFSYFLTMFCIIFIFLAVGNASINSEEEDEENN